MHTVQIQPGGWDILVRENETILDAVRRLGFQCPQSCRNGNCHICVAEIIQGSINEAGRLLASGTFYTCIAKPEGDCVVSWEGVLSADQLPEREVTAQLISMDALGGDVQCVRLRLPAGKPIRYHAGQYLQLQRADGEFNAYSIASAPARGREVELHVLARESSVKALLSDINARGSVRVRMPYGQAHVAALPEGPLILIAAGTGMAQMHSIVEHCLAQGFAHPICVYWGGRTQDDFYALPAWDEWAAQDGLVLHKVVSELCAWGGRCGMLYEAVTEDFSELAGVSVYASGSPRMVYGTMDALIEQGMDEKCFFADALSYAPRS